MFCGEHMYVHDLKHANLMKSGYVRYELQVKVVLDVENPSCN